MTPIEKSAFDLVRKLEEVSPTLGNWARHLARCGWSAEDIKEKLKAAMAVVEKEERRDE